MNFGNYAIVDNVRHYLEKEPTWWWEVKSPTVNDEIALARFIRSDGEEGIGKLNIQIAAREIALTFAATNIPQDPEKPVEDGGKSILKKGAPPEQVEQVLEQMPAEMLYEIWGAVGEAVPMWGPRVPELEEAGGGEDRPKEE